MITTKHKRQNMKTIKQLISIGTQLDKKNNQNPLRLKYRQSITHVTGQQIYQQTDKVFVHEINRMASAQQNMLTNLLGNIKKNALSDNQCDQIDHYARLHYKANIVNQNTDNQFQSVQERYRCICGCKKAKGQPLSLLASIKQMSVLGSGVVLLFMFKKTFSFILLSAVLIYAIFALATNLMGNSSTSDRQCEDSYCQFRSKASSQNKLNSQFFNFIQWWTGVAFCFVWIFVLRLIKYFGKTQDKNIDQYLNSSSDYAVIIQNLPYGEYQQNQLISYFQLLSEKAQRIIKKANLKRQIDFDSENSQSYENDFKKTAFQTKSKNKFNMKNVQIIYNMEFSRVIIKKILELSLQIKDLFVIKKNDKQSTFIKSENLQNYKNLKKQICQTFQFLTDLRKKFLYDENFRKRISTTVALVQFHNAEDKDLFLNFFGNQKIGMLKEVQQKLKSWLTSDHTNTMFRGNVLKIQRAPQPSDLIFTNCQKKFSLRRMLLIYFLTFFIILSSFLIMTALIYFQDYMSAYYSLDQNLDQRDTMITYLNIVISLALQVVNKILWLALFYILDIEYNHTVTSKIISQMNKVLFSTCINIIALPIISNYVIRNNVYGSKGLAGMVFDYQISILGVGIIVKLVDPANFIKRILLNIRKTRNLIIRFICSKLDSVNPSHGVAQINSLYEGAYFDIAQSYVYIMAATYQAAFFCQLQPSLLILVTILVVVFYWVNKYKVLRTCKIPQITQKLIFQAALSQAALIPMVYGAGSIVMSYIETHYNPNLSTNYYPAIISILLGLLGFSNPGDFLNKTTNYFMDKILKYQSKDSRNQSENQSAQNIKQKNAKFGMSDEIKQTQNQKLNRIDNYFRDSNSLPLIAFEHSLVGGDTRHFPQTSISQLQNFCKKFLQNDYQKIKTYNQKKQLLSIKSIKQMKGYPIDTNSPKFTKTTSSYTGDKLLDTLKLTKQNSFGRKSVLNSLNASKFKLPKIQNNKQRVQQNS